MLEKPFAITRGFIHRFPEGQNPFQIMTRLLEECGELAEQVNHFEGIGVKRAKLGDPDPRNLAGEVAGVLHCALNLAICYHVETEVEEVFETYYQRLKAEGHIIEDTVV